MSHPRLVSLTFVAAAILMGMVAQSAVVSGLASFSRPDSLVAGLISLSTLAALVTAVVTAAALFRTPRAVRFTDEVIAELAKVTWPTRDEAVRATTTVVFTTLFVAGLLGLYDLLWKNVADLVLFNAS